MAISIKTPEEIEIMKACGKILAETLYETSKRAKEGVSTADLDKFAEQFIRDQGAEPGFKGYNGYPATLCTGINEIVVHGIPHEEELLLKGDLLTIDCGVKYKGMYTDAARSMQIGKSTKGVSRLIKTAEIALSKAIDLAKPGVKVNQISRTIEATIKNAGYHVIYDLTGHGIGHNLHEEPIIPNYDDGKIGATLEAGMTMAIEPIFSMGTSQIETLEDGWTIITSDDSIAVQIEETILITPEGSQILTSIEN